MNGRFSEHDNRLRKAERLAKALRACGATAEQVEAGLTTEQWWQAVRVSGVRNLPSEKTIGMIVSMLRVADDRAMEPERKGGR